MKADPTLHAAVLLMESHGLAPNVRSTSFSSVRVWARLYQAGPYFLDLHLEPDLDGLGLRGELLVTDDIPVPVGGTVTLYAGPDRDREPARSEVDADLTFALPVVTPDRYRLEVVLAGETLSIDDLTID